MSSNTIEITIIASKRAGILPKLMRKLGSLGLIYRRCGIEELDNKLQLNLSCAGKLECSEEYLVDAILEIPNVDSILRITQGFSKEKSFSKLIGDEDFEKLQASMNEFTDHHPLRANDPITHDILQIVEDRLSMAFGPVANLLLKSAEKKSTRVGDLFLLLAEKLTEDQRITFLKNIEGIDQTSFRKKTIR